MGKRVNRSALWRASGNRRTTPAPLFNERNPATAKSQPKRLNCTAGSESVDHGEDFFRTFALAEAATR